MNKFIFVCLLFFSASSLAVGTMSNRTISGYFTNSNHIDKLVCGDTYLNNDNDSFSYECVFNLYNGKKNWIIVNNNECRYFEIEPGERKGELVTQCGIYNQNTTDSYRYDDILNNWFLYESIIQYGAMDGPDADIPDEVVEFKEQWSIDKTLLKIVDVDSPLTLIKLIEKKYTKKQYKDVVALAKANHLDLSQLSEKTVIQYNNAAFYYQKSGALEQALPILEAIVASFPNRYVAYLNLADTYFALNEPSKALANYKKYIEIMTNKGKANRIPTRVQEFVLSAN